MKYFKSLPLQSIKKFCRSEKLSEKLKAELPFFYAPLLLIAYGGLASFLYVSLTGAALPVTPLMLLKLIYQKALFSQASYLPPHFWVFAGLSLLMPLVYASLLYESYKVKAWQGVKIMLAVTGIFIAWASLADAIVRFLLFHKVTLGNPFETLRLWRRQQDFLRLQQTLSWAFLMASLPLAGGAFWLIGRIKKDKTYGDAHFASYREITKRGLFKQEGVYLGKACRRPLFQDGYEHLFLFSPTGTLKTTSSVIPNLFYWQGSCVCTDIKLTLFNLTSLYRQRVLKQSVYLFNPANDKGMTHGYNCLDFIDRDPLKRIDQIQRLAFLLIPKNPHLKDPFWETQSRQLLIAFIHYVLDNPHYLKTLGEINRLAKSYADFDQWLTEVLETETLHYVCRQNFYSFLDSPPITHQNIRDTFLSHLALFDNPFIEAATSQSDFDLRDLRKKPMTIYIGVPENSLDRLAPLISVFYEQLAHVMTERVPDKAAEPYDVLLLMDEFGRLNRMESFLSITTFREYRLRVFIILQEIAQLYARYGQHEAKLFLNAKVRIAYTINDMETSKYVESCLGNQTLKIKNRSQRLSPALLGLPEVNESHHVIASPLMLAQDVRKLPRDKALILSEGENPIYAQKVPWHQDAQLSQCLQGRIDLPSLMPQVKALFRRAVRKAEQLREDAVQKKAQDEAETAAEKTKTAKTVELLKESSVSKEKSYPISE